MEGHNKNLHEVIKNNEETLKVDLLGKLSQERLKLQEIEIGLPTDSDGNVLFPEQFHDYQDSLKKIKEIREKLKNLGENIKENPSESSHFVTRGSLN